MNEPDDTAVESLTDMWSERDILAEAEALGHLGAWAWHISTGQLWWSDEIYRIFGRSPQEFPATYEAFLHCIHPDDRAQVEQRVRAAVEGTELYDVAHRVLRPPGEVRHVREQGSVTRAADGRPVRMLGLVQDVTEEVALREALAASEARYRLLAEHAWDIIWTMELDRTLSYVSPSVERVRGFTPAEAAEQSLEEMHPPQALARISDYFSRLFAAIAAGTALPTFHGEQEYYRKDGSIMFGELDVIPQVDASGNVLRILGVTRDVKERREFEDKLSRLAVTDSLTGVWNRRHGQELFNTDMYDARRYGPEISLLMIDIDRFKDINDTYGHQAGDLVLVELCARLGSHLRATDVLVRWGGEEFVVLIRHCALAEALVIADTLRALIADTPFAGVGTVTVSIGAAQFQPDDDLGSWVHRADRAMYEAEAAGRNAVRAEA